MFWKQVRFEFTIRGTLDLHILALLGFIFLVTDSLFRYVKFTHAIHLLEIAVLSIVEGILVYHRHRTFDMMPPFTCQ